MKTPQTLPTDTAVFVVRVPNAPEVREAVRGVLAILYYVWAWQQSSGGETPEDTAAAVLDRMTPLEFTVE